MKLSDRFFANIHAKMKRWKNPWQHGLQLTQSATKDLQLEAERKVSRRANASIERMAYYDALTDLPNRRKFIQLLAKYQQQVNDGAPGFAVGVIDIIDFKTIEDVYGRVAGNALLRQIADRLLHINETILENKGLVARLADDEFVLLVPEIENVQQAYDFGQLLFPSLKQDFHLPDAKISLSFTTGFSLYPYSDSNPDRLITRANMARKKAATSNENTIGVFNLEIELQQLRHARVSQALTSAISNGDIEPWFQPIINLSDGKIAGFEALARWHDESLGPVSPDEFIEIAEQGLLIEHLTLNMFEKALAVAKTWSPDTKLFFNVSAKLISHQQSVEKMLDILKVSGLPPTRLDIELTETVVMKNIDLARQQMQKFKDVGVGIALDDFGSGYSSLAQIRDLPLDKVKIDKSFTDKICTDSKFQNVVSAIIQLCHKIDIACVVEGIENHDQLAMLSEMNCQYGQGYLFSPAVPAKKTIDQNLLMEAA